jgi:hypothetical protein
MGGLPLREGERGIQPQLVCCSPAIARVRQRRLERGSDSRNAHVLYQDRLTYNFSPIALFDTP